ncbi:hypothetical protein ASF28_09140 [Methylobacterium sp. Leaf99]|nr:hypothetical protein ASF28_09140 [Methylobacterium sp. Leaf99]
MIETIPHSVAKLTMAGYSQTLTCAGSALRKGPGRQGCYRQPRISGALLLVPVLLFLGFRARPVARSLGRLPYRAVIGVARGYGRSALVRLGVLLTFPPRLVVGRLGQVLIRSAQVGHASLSGCAGNALGEGTVRMGFWEYASGTDRAWAKEAV